MAFADDFKRGIDRAIRIAKMERPAVAEVADDGGAFPVGVAIIAVAGLAQGLGSLLRAGPMGGIGAVFIAPLLVVLFSFIGVGILYLVGMLFKPQQWDFQRLYRALSHTYILQWTAVAGLVPVVGGLIGILAGLYQLVLSVIAVQEVGKLDLVKAILIVLIPGLVCCGLVAAFLAAFGMAALGLGRSLAQ